MGTDANAGNQGFGGIDILDLQGNLVHSIDTTALGGINSVAVKNGQAAVSITAPVKTDPGVVRFYEAGSFGLLSEVRVGTNPDAVVYTPDGSRLLVANEGDDRNDWGPDDAVRVNDFAASDIDPALNAKLTAAHGADWRTNNDKLNRLTVSTTGDTDGDGDLDVLQAFGGRSFSILDASGRIVFDSGDRIEEIVRAQYPGLWDDSRSDNKGPEPESVAVGTVGGHDLLFVGLERSNAVMVWDLTSFLGSSSDPVRFVDMLFAPGDVGPEGLSFFGTPDGAFLAVANEVSETTSLFRITAIPDGGHPLAMTVGGAMVLGGVRRRFGLARARGRARLGR